MDEYTVPDKDTFLETISDFEEYDEPILSSAQAEQLWDLWAFRAENGSDQQLLYVPGWFTEKEFDKRRPFLFVTIEYDNDEKNAVLFSDTWFIDISIIENEVWHEDGVTIDQTLERLDISEGNDYIDDAGKTWIPRSLCTCLKGGPQ